VPLFLDIFIFLIQYIHSYNHWNSGALPTELFLILNTIQSQQDLFFRVNIVWIGKRKGRTLYSTVRRKTFIFEH
jgi:hypothetical protein